MDSDDDQDLLRDSGSTAKSLTQKRRAQKAAFDAWLSTASGQAVLKSKVKDSNATDGVADENLSLHALMLREGSQIIKHPREYQLELFERAKQENTIAVLDTGSGKTLIAALLIRWTIDQELERRDRGQAERITFFLVNSVTLAYQQFSVLETNLDHKVLRICGADNPDSWTPEKWRLIFSETKVIVCTADVLHWCLSRSYIHMRDISLLIFDEAHHTKKNHSYARIMKDFYMAQISDSCRPRVFGMTASPVDAKTDVAQATIELEALLHSKIATTSEMSLSQSVMKPDDVVLRFSGSLQLPLGTSLLQAANAQFGHITVMKKPFATAKEIARDLGRWCADEFLLNAVSDRQMGKYERKLEQSFYRGSRLINRPELDAKLAELRKAAAFVKTYQLPSELADDDLSPKVRKLYEYLRAEFERPSDHRCIVFVEQRYNARLLCAVFQKLGFEHMHCAFLVGSGNDDVGEHSMAFREQVMTMIKFRHGEVNCLFSTSVAEEGLDVPDCNLVIRFDMYRTMIQYVQSRGRARERNSRFVHMLENGNMVQDQLMRDVRVAEAAMRRFCEMLPEDRRLIGNQDTLESLLEKEKVLETYRVEETRATLTYGNALTILANFVAAIPNETEEFLSPTYIVSSRGPRFSAEVLLPASSPLRSIMGEDRSKRSLAKRSAAFNACKELLRKGYLDKFLKPTYQKRLPAMRNALLAADLDKKNQYDMRAKPKMWENGRGVLSHELWVTIIDFPNGLERKHQPLALLTRSRLPALPEFPLFLNDGRQTMVRSTSFTSNLTISKHRLEQLSTFTFRVFHDVASKKYEEDSAQLSYWIAPAVSACSDGTSASPENNIDWKVLDDVHNNSEYPWKPDTPMELLVDRFLVDKWDGSRKFFSTGFDTSLRPSDPLPEGVAKGKWNGSILDYSVSLYRKAREKATWNPDQPVMTAEKVLTRRNLLAPPVDKELRQSSNAYLCPEPLKISAIPASVAASCFVFPAVIHRFESYLIALDACDMVGIKCDPSVALAAMTKDSDSPDENEGSEQINFQRGMGENYERLEFIGDTFLKTATSISTFIRNPKDDEFAFHVKRMLLLCNKNLFDVAVKLELYEYIRSMAFSRRLWYPEGLILLEGKGASKEVQKFDVQHRLGQKTIADVSEALIGAAFVTYDRPGEKWKEANWQSAVHAVSKLVGSPEHVMETWDNYRKAYQKPEYQLKETTASQRDLARKVETEHPYRFQYPQLLRSAFIHPSQPFTYERIPSYQRLEFLGDALLDLAIVTHLFNRFPDKDPQWLTEHKMAMVSNKFLGAVCVNIGFHKHLRYATPILEPQIREYTAQLEEAKSTAGESRDYWTTVTDPPKCLPDIVESYIGAMFIDSNFDYSTVQDFFDRHIKWYFEDMSIYDTFANSHPCTHLHRLLQTTYGCDDYRLMARELPPADGVEAERKDVVAVVMIHNEIIAHSKGKSGRYARVRAANNALEYIQGLAPFQFRGRFGCNCVLQKNDHEAVPSSGQAVDCSI